MEAINFISSQPDESGYRNILDSALDSVFVIHGETYVYVNKQGARLLGFDFPEELIGKNMFDFTHVDDHNIVRERGNARQRGEDVQSRYEINLVRKNGKKFPAEVQVSYIKYDGKGCSLSYTRDITDRKKNEESLQVLHLFTAQMASSKDIDVIERVLYKAIKQVLGFNRGSLSFVNGDMLTHKYRWNMNIQHSFDMHLDGLGITIRAVNTGKTQYVEDILEDPDYVMGGEAELATRSELVVPIWIKDNVIGVINLENKKVNAFSEKDVKIVEILAVHTGIALERVHTRDQMKTLNEELERSNQELENYTYVVSHDLKAPLRSIRSFGSFIMEDNTEQLNEDCKEYLCRIINAATHMDDLIGDLLTLSRVGRKYSDVEVFDLNNLLVSIEKDIYSFIEEKGAVIKKDQMPLINGQKTWIRQLFMNLITNGLKFNVSEKPTIEIRVEDTEQEYLFSVSDNGIGIAPEYHEKIFQLFERLHSKAEYEGTGAGLTICKKIVDDLGGRMWVESEKGTGSRFYFTFPKKEVAV